MFNLNVLYNIFFITQISSLIQLILKIVLCQLCFIVANSFFIYDVIDYSFIQLNKIKWLLGVSLKSQLNKLPLNLCYLDFPPQLNTRNRESIFWIPASFPSLNESEHRYSLLLSTKKPLIFPFSQYKSDSRRPNSIQRRRISGHSFPNQH